MSNTIADIGKAEVILVTGSNTTENHPVISAIIKRAAHYKNTKLIVVDPRRIKLAEFAHLWLRPRPGTDVAWINGLLHVIIKENLLEKTFIENRTTGFDALAKVVEKYNPDMVSEITGIPAQDIIKAARMYAGGSPASIVYCMGITQHISGTDNVKSLANLAMTCGNLGVPGGGVNPLRGQNNVQGACDMGGLPDVYSGYQKVTDPAIRQKMEAAWEVSDLPEKPGLKATEMVPMAHEGKVKALYIAGENPLVSDPDLNHTEESFRNLDFLVVQDIFMTETARMADVVFPVASFAEKDGTFSNTERRVQRIRKAVPAPGGAREDWQILCDIATRMGYSMTYPDARTIFDEIRSVTPSYAGITYDRIETEGIHWPCPTTDHPGTPILHVDQFPIGKGVFFPIEWVAPDEITDEQYNFYLTTGRLLYHYHTGTMTRKVDGLNERAPENYVEVSPNDAEKYGLSSGDMVEVSSRRGRISAKTKISSTAVDGTVFIPFHFAESAVNRLTNAALDPVSKIPEFKVCAVKLEKV